MLKNNVSVKTRSDKHYVFSKKEYNVDNTSHVHVFFKILIVNRLSFELSCIIFLKVDNIWYCYIKDIFTNKSAETNTLCCCCCCDFFRDSFRTLFKIL